MRLLILVALGLTSLGCAHTRTLPHPELVPVVVKGPDQGLVVRFNGTQAAADSLYVCMTRLQSTTLQLEMDCLPYRMFLEQMQEQFNTTDSDI